ncbi:phage holin family protein [Candidatus Formimonas warabiya]|uniref:Phage holin family protein n=1 Tax=Formimonas warabiya TaxID=1761012 RepID=A0A3G1KV26_FORW1|nr:phage holin family protein [Candidatus Formimonas warabiya]ATW26267.1 hypothetical protein DCMF_17225 [Candidatus Formimonas warabiya]
MSGIITRWLINAVALLLTAGLIPGITITGVFSAIVAAIVWGIVNAVIRPIILVLTLPINVLTLGLFTLFVNGFMLKIVDHVVVGFDTQGFWATVFGALVLSLISGIFSVLVRDR